MAIQKTSLARSFPGDAHLGVRSAYLHGAATNDLFVQ
jgi:hypothetical protein